MEIFFLTSEKDLPSAEEQKAWRQGDYWHKFPRWAASMEYCWIYQTWFLLQQAGVECHLTTQIPPKGVLISTTNTLVKQLPAFKEYALDLFIINILGDREPFLWSHLSIVQNGIHTASLKNSCYIPHWPQPHVIPRNQERGDRLETVAFFGGLGAIDSQLISPLWYQQLEEELGMNMLCPHAKDWYDFREIDVALGIRSFSRNRYLHKPASKLYNAWQGGVPFIGGIDSAFKSDGHPGKDYLIARNPKELLYQLKKLKKNRHLREQLVANGQKRFAQFSHEATLARWRSLLEKKLPLILSQWQAKSYRQRVHFWKERYRDYQYDWRARPEFYMPRHSVGSWGSVLESFDKMKAYRDAATKQKKKARQLLSEGNADLYERWNRIAHLLEQLAYMESPYLSYQEVAPIPYILDSDYRQQGEEQFCYYMKEGERQLQENNFTKSHFFIGWARSFKEANNYYESLVPLIFREWISKYNIDDQMLQNTQAMIEQEYQQAVASGCHDMIEQRKNLLADITAVTRLRQAMHDRGITEETQERNPLLFYNAKMALFQLFYASMHQELIVAQKIGLSDLFKPAQRSLLLAKKSAQWRWQASLEREKKDSLRAPYLERAAFWSFNQSRIYSLKLQLFWNSQLMVRLPPYIDRILKATTFTLCGYEFFILPLLRLASLSSFSFLKKMIGPLASFFEKPSRKGNEQLIALIDEHTVSPEIEANMRKIARS